MTRLLFSFILLTSCSSVHFKSNNQASVSFDYRLDRDQEITLEIQKKFYLWGMYPKKHEIVLDELFQTNGYDSVSDLRVEEIETMSKALWMIGTLGMYYPQSFRLVGRVSN